MVAALPIREMNIPVTINIMHLLVLLGERERESMFPRVLGFGYVPVNLSPYVYSTMQSNSKRRTFLKTAQNSRYFGRPIVIRLI
jgi:hypothetical protein